MSWKCLALAIAACNVATSATVSFEKDIRPLLAKHCAGCHQPASKAAELDLTTYEGFRAGGKRGKAFEAGAPEASLVVRYLTGEMKPPMPLGAPPLGVEAVNLFREWIKAGAENDGGEEEEATAPMVYRQAPVITALRFSPDGKMLAVNGNREVVLHGLDGSGMKRLRGKSERILSVVFSADGKLLVAGGGTPARFGEIQFWDVAGGRLLRSVRVTADTVFGTSMAPDGSKVAAGGADNSVYVFETQSGKELYKISSHENWVLGTVFGVDSKRFVSVGRDRAAKLVDAEAGQFLENVNQLRGELAAVARHPGKDIVVVGGEERIPYIYAMDRPRNMKVGEEATLVKKLEAQGGPIYALEWSPDGKRIAVAGGAAAVNIYDADSGQRVASCTGHRAGIYALAYSPGGERLATGGFDGQIRIYRAGDCTLERAMAPVPVEGAGQAGGMR